MIFYVSFAVIVFVVIIIWIACAGLFGTTLNLEIKPLDVFSLAVNIAIAFLLQYYLANKTTDLRSEKDILIGNINDVHSILRSCRDSLAKCHNKEKIDAKLAAEIIVLFRSLSNGITHLEDSVALSQCSKLNPDVHSIWGEFDHYKLSSTSAPFPKKPTSHAEQERAFRSLSSKLQSLAFKINKFR